MKVPTAEEQPSRGSTDMMHSLNIQGFTFEGRQGLLPMLTSALTECGGWVVESTMLSPATMELRLEIHLWAALDLYATIIESGVELTSSGHDALTELCTRRKYMPHTGETGRVVTLRLEIDFRQDLPLNRLFEGESGSA